MTRTSMTRPRAFVVALAGLALCTSTSIGCPRPSAPAIVADPAASDATPNDVASAPLPPLDARIGDVLECAPHVAGDDCFGNKDFPLHCTYVGANDADEARLWDAVWRDGKHHAQFDALDVWAAAKSPRLPDARCLRTGPDTDYNMFAWCCRAP
jgi:hypothetical protein